MPSSEKQERIQGQGSAVEWERWPGLSVPQSERDEWARKIAAGECLSITSGDSIVWGEIDKTDGETSIALTDARIVRIAKVPRPSGVNDYRTAATGLADALADAARRLQTASELLVADGRIETGALIAGWANEASAALRKAGREP